MIVNLQLIDTTGTFKKKTLWAPNSHYHTVRRDLLASLAQGYDQEQVLPSISSFDGSLGPSCLLRWSWLSPTLAPRRARLQHGPRVSRAASARVPRRCLLESGRQARQKREALHSSQALMAKARDRPAASLLGNLPSLSEHVILAVTLDENSIITFKKTPSHHDLSKSDETT